MNEFLDLQRFFLFLKLGQCLSVKTRYVFGPVNELRCKVKVDDNSLDLEDLALQTEHSTKTCLIL